MKPKKRLPKEKSQMRSKPTPMFSSTADLLCDIFMPVATVILFTTIAPSVLSQNIVASSKWDLDSPSISLVDVRIHANSLQEAWKNFSTTCMVRSVLFIGDESSYEGVFHFEKQKCKVAEVYDALVSAYPKYIWTQDTKSGIVWFHPANVAYETLLSTPLIVSSEQFGVPMYSGILRSLENIPPLGLRATGGGTAFLNTFNYSVNLPQGIHSLRDLFNLCCLANPSKTFSFRSLSENQIIASPVNLVSDDVTKSPPGAVSFWKAEIGDTKGNLPSDEDMISALADPNPRTRWAARQYLEFSVWAGRWDRWVRELPSKEKALWVTLAVFDLIVCVDDSTYRNGINRVNKEFSEELFLSGDPKLALLTALEVARVGKDTRALEIICKRKLTDADLSGIISDLCRICRASKLVRDKIREMNPDWPGFSRESLDRFESAAIFQLASPTPNK